MNIKQTILKGCYLLEPNIHTDTRGYFFERFNKYKFKEQTGLDIDFVQENESKSTYGVIRGLHFQKGIHAQAKLVSVVEGEILDVAVDIRDKSSQYGEHIAVRLSLENKRQLFIPRGFAHGFVVLSSYAVVQYRCDRVYAPEFEDGIAYNDSFLDIDWKIPVQDIIISEKDKKYKKLKKK